MIEPKRSIKFLERKEIESIIASIKPIGMRNLRDRALFEVLFSTGMRIHEALELPDAPFISEHGQTMELSISGKGGYQRVVFFSPQALKAIKVYLAVRKDSNTELFPISIRRAQQIVKYHAERAGFEGVHPHTFRHSLAVHLLQQGASLYYVSQFLGHRSLSSTSHYLHTTNKELKGLHSLYMK